MGKKNKEKIFTTYLLHILLCSQSAMQSRAGIQFTRFTASQLSHDSPSVLQQVQNVTYYLKRK